MRPLSPHIQIYKWQSNSVLSMLHRITGVILGVCSLLFAWWLISIAGGAESYEVVRRGLGSLAGRVVLVGFTWALFYHLCNGIRHLAWDLGLGYSSDAVSGTGWAAMAASLVFTLITFVFALT